MTSEERAQYEQLLERILQDVAELRATQEELMLAIADAAQACRARHERDQAHLNGLRQRADRLDAIRDRYAVGSNGSWLLG